MYIYFVKIIDKPHSGANDMIVGLYQPQCLVLQRSAPGVQTAASVTLGTVQVHRRVVIVRRGLDLPTV